MKRLPAFWKWCRWFLPLVGGGGMAKAARHVRMQKAMEEMFAGFAPDGKPSADVSAGSETSLYGITNSFVFFLNFFADFHACLVFLFGLLANIGKIVVEDDGT